MHSEESARLMECSNRTRQAALAIQLYISALQSLPSMRDEREGSVVDPWIVLDSHLGLDDQHRIAIDRGTAIAPAVHSCPSDFVGGKNYRMNHGISVTWDSGLRRYYKNAADGPIVYGPIIRPSSIRDGLSQTAVISERLCGVGYREEHRSIGMGPIFPSFGQNQRTTPTIERRWLENNQNTMRTFDFAGINLMEFGFDSSVYNHAQTPNQPFGCTFAGGFSSAVQVGFLGPTSLHSGAVVVAMLDGSVHTISDSIDEGVWLSMGSIHDAAGFNR